MHVPCDKPFQLAPCRDLDLDLWPFSRSNLLPHGGPQFSEFACFKLFPTDQPLLNLFSACDTVTVIIFGGPYEIISHANIWFRSTLKQIHIKYVLIKNFGNIMYKIKHTPINNPNTRNLLFRFQSNAFLSIASCEIPSPAAIKVPELSSLDNKINIPWCIIIRL